LSRDPWSKDVQDRWFLGTLVVTFVAVLYLFSPFLYVVGAAGVVVIVTWPLFEWVNARTKDRRAVSAILTVLILFLAVFGPLATVVWLAVLEGAETITWVQDYIDKQQWKTDFAAATLWWETIQTDPRVQQILTRLPADFDPVGKVTEVVQGAIGIVAESIGKTGLTAVTKIINTLLDVAIFLGALITLYMEGPHVVEAAKKISPIDNEYEDRLFGVFAEFAKNMVIGSLATGAIQGMVAGMGYLIAGAPSVIFLSIVTGVCSFVPMVGTAVVWIPVALWVGVNVSWGWAAFVAVWSIAFTGSVDNVLKPLFLRGSSNIHPMLIFLAVFGGLGWLGLPGVLIGPVLVALATSMYKIYKEDFLGEGPEPEDDGEDWVSWLSDKLMIWRERRDAQQAGPAGTSSLPSSLSASAESPSTPESADSPEAEEAPPSA